jgi:hypothetical protein
MELWPHEEGRLRVVTREEYRRMEGFVYELEPERPDDLPMLRYVLVNIALAGGGLAAWTVAVAALVWMFR